MMYLYDRSEALALALVARADLSAAAYVPLQDAPTQRKAIATPYLRQLHAVAGTVVSGVYAHVTRPLRPELWESGDAAIAGARRSAE